MKKYDVYDFDKTLYINDSTVMFYLYCLKNNKKVRKYLPTHILYFIKYQLKLIKKQVFKEKFFEFVECIEDIDKEVENFWKENKTKIRFNLLEKTDNEKIVISASPEFLLNNICKEIGVSRVMASEVDKKTGKFYSNNCFGEEKVKRFNKEFKNAEIENFFSDSLTDTPLAEISKNSYLVKKNKVVDWIYK